MLKCSKKEENNFPQINGQTFDFKQTVISVELYDKQKDSTDTSADCILSGLQMDQSWTERQKLDRKTKNLKRNLL